MKNFKILFISDFFESDYQGGAESNDQVLIDHLLSTGFKVRKEYSYKVSIEDVQRSDYCIVSNFSKIFTNEKSVEVYNFLMQSGGYIIYEHDHKYILNRRPVFDQDYKIDKNRLCNQVFYQRADAVFVLSSVCERLLKNNIKLVNIVNIGTSLWSREKFKTLKETLSSSKKQYKYGLLNSRNIIKGTSRGLEYCQEKGIKPYMINSNLSYADFLVEVSKCEKIIFFPRVLESFSRYAAECKVLDCKLITSKGLLGFCYEEELLRKSGIDLLLELEKRTKKALNAFSTFIVEKLKKEHFLKIAFIGKFSNIYDEQGKALALEALGHHVYRFEESLFDKTRWNNSQVLFSLNPDFVMFPKLNIPNKDVFLQDCHKKGIKTIAWNPDLYVGLAERESEIKHKKGIFNADFVATSDGGNQEFFEKYGVNHICIKQGISKEYLTPPVDEEMKDLDIVFIGTLNMSIHGERRRRLLEHLSKKYVDKFHWFGQTGDRELRDDDLEDVIKRAKIVIGDCVPSDNYWSNRVYEVLGRGGFLIHPDIPGLEHHYEDGEEICFFKLDNLEDLDKKIKLYLNNPEERREIAEKGFKKTKKAHTLVQRASLLLGEVDLK